MDQARRGQRGFSLIELMVAMAITLIVSASIYALVAGGQNAFRRDPEISERQQNIRVAMERITRDLTVAGMGMYTPDAGDLATSGFWGQIFEDGNEQGPADIPSVIKPGELTDTLYFMGDDGECPNVPIASVSGANVNTVDGYGIPDCYPEPGLVFALYGNGVVKRGWGHNIHSAGGKKLNFPPGQQPDWPISQIQSNQSLDCSWVIDEGAGENCPAGNQNEPPIALVNMTLFAYQIARDTDGIPSLYRSLMGGMDVTTESYSDPPAGGGWQLLARGITDLQVEYLNGDGVWQDSPYPSGTTEGDYTKIVRQVRITLQARTTGNANLGTDSSQVIQGRLTSTVTPRSALFFLSTAPSPHTWR